MAELTKIPRDSELFNHIASRMREQREPRKIIHEDKSKPRFFRILQMYAVKNNELEENFALAKWQLDKLCGKTLESWGVFYKPTSKSYLLLNNTIVENGFTYDLMDSGNKYNFTHSPPLEATYSIAENHWRGALAMCTGTCQLLFCKVVLGKQYVAPGPLQEVFDLPSLPGRVFEDPSVFHSIYSDARRVDGLEQSEIAVNDQNQIMPLAIVDYQPIESDEDLEGLEEYRGTIAPSMPKTSIFSSLRFW